MTLVAKMRLLHFLLIITFWACEPKQKAYVQLGGNAQGTTFAITYEPTEDITYEKEVDQLFKDIDHSMSLWDSSSLIVQFNKAEKELAVDDYFKEVLEASIKVNKETDGAFDPTVGPVVKAWGFARKNDLTLPSDAQIDSLKAFVGINKVSLEDEMVKKSMPEVQLDFNAIAQGYTVDVIASFLRSKGVKNYLIEVGGELRCEGFNSKGQEWNIGIEKPNFNATEQQNEVQDIVSLSGISLATSGNYRKFVEKDGKKYSHTIDPKTGKPVTHHLLSVSVLASTCMEADAYATAYMVMGKDKAMATANKKGMYIQCVVDEEGELKTYRSAGFEQFIVKP